MKTNILELFIKKYYKNGKDFCSEFNITEATLVKWKKSPPELLLKVIFLIDKCNLLNKELEYEKNYSKQLELKLLQKE